MATLRSSIQIYDGMTGPLRSITRAMNITISSFEAMQRVSSNAIDTASLNDARAQLASANVAFDIMEQEIKQSNQAQQQLNANIYKGNSAADGLLNKFKSLVATVGAGIGVSKIIGLSDNLAQSEARLSLIVDDGGSVEALQQKIFASSQAARGSYLDTMQTVSKLGLMAGNAFTGNNEMIKFTELMNKNFIIGGASIQEQTSAMYQLTQAMASGRLQGDEYRSIIENAPLLANSIEEYMRKSGVEGTMKEWASDGLLTANVIKGALFTSADEIEARFASMPMTWGQVFTAFKNEAVIAFQPVLSKINELANNEQFQNFYKDIVGGLYAIGSMAIWAFDIMTSMGSGIYENWSWISPILFGVATAFMVLHGAQLAYNVVMGITNGLKAIGAARTMMTTVAVGAETTATFAATAAQHGFNAALLACPLTWIVIGIISIVAAIYIGVAAFNKFTDSSVSATGVVAGVFATLGAHIFNTFVVPTWNTLAAFANFIANFCNDPVAAVKVLFYDMAQTVIGYILNIASAIEGLINKIPGMSADITSGLRCFYDGIAEASQNVKNESGWVEYVKKIDYMAYGDAYRSGYDWGAGVEKKISGMFNGGYDPIGQMAMNDALSGIGANTGQIADNTGSMRDSLSIAEEDLKYLRDLAEQEAINRYTTATIKLDMPVYNTVHNASDIDGLVDSLTDGVSEAVNSMAEGVHY